MTRVRVRVGTLVVAGLVAGLGLGAAVAACSKRPRSGSGRAASGSVDGGAAVQDVALVSCVRAPLGAVRLGMGTGIGFGGGGFGTTTAGRIGLGGIGHQRGPGLAEVAFQVPTVTPATDRDVVRRMLRRATAGFDDCLRKARAGAGITIDTTGSAHFQIATSGRAKGTVVEGVPDQTVTRCLEARLNEIAYPKFQTSVDVTVEVELFPAGRPLAVPPVPADVMPWLREQATPALSGTVPVLASCLGAARRRVPGLGGTLLTSVQVDGTGVVQAHAVGGLGDAGLEQCVDAALGKLMLPPPPRDVSVDCSFTLGRAAAYRPTAIERGQVVRVGGQHVVPDRVVTLGPPTLVVVAPDTDGFVLANALGRIEGGRAWAIDRGDAQPPELITSFASLPRLTPQGAEPGAEPIELWVRKSGILIGTRDPEPVQVSEPAGIAAALRTLVASRPGLAGRRDIVIALDPDASYGRLVEIMRQAIAAGFAEIEVVGVMQLELMQRLQSNIAG